LERKKTFLFLVRHGETEWNLKKRYQGQTEIRLNARGRRQARLTARRLAGIAFHAVYSSDLSRAKECAEILAKSHGLEVKALAALRERNFGKLEGLTREEAKRRRWWKRIEESDGFAAAPAGETRLQMRQRVIRCMNEIIARHEGQKVLIVTHGGPISQMVCDFLGVSARKQANMRLDNCSLSVIRISGEHRTLMLLNDVGHLYPKAAVGAMAAMKKVLR